MNTIVKCIFCIRLQRQFTCALNLQQCFASGTFWLTDFYRHSMFAKRMVQSIALDRLIQLISLVGHYGAKGKWSFGNLEMVP